MSKKPKKPPMTLGQVDSARKLVIWLGTDPEQVKQCRKDWPTAKNPPLEAARWAAARHVSEQIDDLSSRERAELFLNGVKPIRNLRDINDELFQCEPEDLHYVHDWLREHFGLPSDLTGEEDEE